MEEMEEMQVIRVLWIDDEPKEAFIDEASTYGLDIDNEETVRAGRNALKDRNRLYDAVILDANCKIDDVEESADINALKTAITEIYRLNTKLPWFVYTGENYDGSEALKYIIPESGKWWESKHWYNKPKDSLQLYEDIRNAVLNSDDAKVKHKYNAAFSIIPSLELLDLLKSRHTKEFSYDYNVPINIRIVCENLCDYLKSIGIFPASFKSSNKLKECSLFFSNDKQFEYVTSYIQALFYFLNSYCNEGSHAQSKGDSEKRMSKVRSDIKAGKAIHLNTVALVSLLSVVDWVSHLPVNDLEKMKPIHSFFARLYQNWAQASVFENHEGIVEQDDKGNVHCESCALSYKAKEHVGKRVKLSSVKENTNDNTKLIYPYFAKYKTLE